MILYIIYMIYKNLCCTYVNHMREIPFLLLSLGFLQAFLCTFIINIISMNYFLFLPLIHYQLAKLGKGVSD